MGYYIECQRNTGKAKQIFDSLPDAKIETGPFFDETGKRVGVCVVENGPFDAAAIAFSKREMEAFSGTARDFRRRTWLSLPRETVIQVCPAVEKHLPEIKA